MLAKLVTAAISPLGTALLLAVLALLCAALGWRRRAWGLALAGTLWLAAWSTPLASHALRGRLEAPYPPVPVLSLPAAPVVVVLGGGVAPPATAQGLPQLEAAADRVWHAARVYHAGKAPLVLASGGGVRGAGAVSEAAAMAQLLAALGVPPGAVLLEDRSTNTAENARYSAQLLQARGINRVLLVTSALHMRRALAEFAAAGLQAHPAATDHEADNTRTWPAWRRWLPDASALEGSARAVKEWVGTAAAAARPAPATAHPP